MKSPEETPQFQFLCSFAEGGVDYRGVEYQDIYLSDYNHEKVKELPNVSPKRWVLGLDLKLWPGSGSGTVVIAGEYFDVKYAWAGRSKPHFEGWTCGDCTSYTVRLEGKGVRDAITKLHKEIIKDECGATQYGVKFRDYEAKRGIKSRKAGEEQVRSTIAAILGRKPKKGDPELNKLYKKLKAELEKTPMSERIADYRKQWKLNRTMMLDHSMKRIETDMI